jgi:hypothetical protein
LSLTSYTTSPLQPNGTFAEYVDVYSPLLKHNTPGCPHYTTTEEKMKAMEDFQEFMDFEEFYTRLVATPSHLPMKALSLLYFALAL